MILHILLLLIASLVSSQEESQGKISIPWGGRTIADLRSEYYNIFPNRNRNAASHRWATFLIERAKSLERTTFEDMFSGFCPVSGSPIGSPSARTLWNMTLPWAGTSELVNGGIHFCCWPCVCDTTDFIRVDTKTVEVKDGTFSFNFLVLGNPCQKDSSLIPVQAPDAKCNGEELVKATYSDNGYVIIGLLQDLTNKSAQDEVQVADHCTHRANTGYRSGMGTIFREVAGINPIPAQFQLGSSVTHDEL